MVESGRRGAMMLLFDLPRPLRTLNRLASCGSKSPSRFLRDPAQSRPIPPSRPTTATPGSSYYGVSVPNSSCLSFLSSLPQSMYYIPA